MTKREKRKQKEKDRGIVGFMMVTTEFIENEKEDVGKQDCKLNKEE